MIKYFISIIIAVFLFAGVVHAEFYTWEDEQGMVHVTDYPPPTQSVKNMKIRDYEDSRTTVDAEEVNKKSKRPSEKGSSASAQKRSADAEVELYVTSWCPYSQKAIEYFQSRNIRFKEYDIEKDSSAAARLEKIAPRSGVPVAVINGDIIGGFRPKDYEESLNKR